jgi:hypothetical protein
MRRLLLAALLLLPAGPAGAAVAPVVAVLSSDLGAYSQALRGFEAGFGGKVPVSTMGQGVTVAPETKVVVAFGGRAAARPYPKGTLVISCLAPGLPGEPDDGGTRVRMVPLPEKLLGGIRDAQPMAKALAVLWSNPGFDEYALALKKAGAKLGLEIVRVDLADEDELPSRLRALRGEADAIWLAPDPELLNERSFAILRQFSRSTRLPLYVPTAELVKEGATAAVAVSFFEAGRVAGLAARRALAGETLPPRIFADKVELVFDGQEAERDGLRLSTSVVRVGLDGKPH